MRRIDWAELYQTFAPELMGVCRRYVKNINEAEDIVHNTFEVGMNKIDTYSGKGSFEGWMKRIAINLCIQFLREKKKSLINLKEYQHILSVEMLENNLFENKMQSSFNAIELLEVIDQLPEHHKLVFNLYVLDGFKHQQIAQMLNISIGTSKSHLSRARKKAQILLLNKTKQKEFTEIHHSVWVLLLLLRFDLIDLIFKKGLLKFSIRAGTIKDTVSNSKGISIPSIRPVLAKVVLCIGIVIMVATIIYVAMQNVQNEIRPESNNALFLKPLKDSIVEVVPDTFQIREEALFLQPEKKDTLKTSPRIVVRKKIIVRDTVYETKP